MLARTEVIKLLAPIDLIEIEREHAELSSFLHELRSACACSKFNRLNNCDFCDHEKTSSCQGRLSSFMFYGLYLVDKHFDHEETIILNTLHVTKKNELFRLHQQAHDEILQKLITGTNEWSSVASSKNTPLIYSQFYKVFDNLLKEHDHKFDAPFVQFTNS